MSIIFAGRAFASKKEKELKEKVQELKKKGINPTLASILVGEDPASKLYVALKGKAAERAGIKLEVFDSVDVIEDLNKDPRFQGIMIQLPLPQEFKARSQEIVNTISPQKDVDGLRGDSKFLHPTSKAVVDILKEAEKELNLNPKSVCVVGSGGMVGAPLVKELKRLGYELIEERNQADVLISCTGVAGLITADMVKDGAIVIDVGSPKGDVDFAGVSPKAAFITPVPGGVGPVTISCLLENLISAC